MPLSDILFSALNAIRPFRMCAVLSASVPPVLSIMLPRYADCVTLSIVSLRMQKDSSSTAYRPQYPFQPQGSHHLALVCSSWLFGPSCLYLNTVLDNLSSFVHCACWNYRSWYSWFLMLILNAENKPKKWDLSPIWKTPFYGKVTLKSNSLLYHVVYAMDW